MFEVTAFFAQVNNNHWQLFRLPFSNNISFQILSFFKRIGLIKDFSIISVKSDVNNLYWDDINFYGTETWVYAYSIIKNKFYWYRNGICIEEQFLSTNSTQSKDFNISFLKDTTSSNYLLKISDLDEPLMINILKNVSSQNNNSSDIKKLFKFYDCLLQNKFAVCTLAYLTPFTLLAKRNDKVTIFMIFYCEPQPLFKYKHGMYPIYNKTIDNALFDNKFSALLNEVKTFI